MPKKTPKKRPAAPAREPKKKQQHIEDDPKAREPLSWWGRRKYRKIRKQVLAHCRLARRMTEDLSDEKWTRSGIAELDASEHEKLIAFEKTFKETDITTRLAFHKDAENLVETANKVYPPRPMARVREHVEIIVVAVAVAVGFRTYFFQPFRIPTGSMMPTLYGITYDQMDQNDEALGRWESDGQKRRAGVYKSDRVQEHTLVDKLMIPKLNISPRTIFSGTTVEPDGRVRRSGDTILVNKMKYHFVEPDRGDVIVFDTGEVDYPSFYEQGPNGERVRKPKQFYIKRLAGLPGETIQVEPPYLIADGQRVETPIFQRVASEKSGWYIDELISSGGTSPNDPETYPGYPGYRREGIVSRSIDVPEDYFLPFGDNAKSSLDGRYFGPQPRKILHGPAFAVIWPFQRFGFID